VNYKYNKIGISLIVLVITIIVIIILAGAVILTLSANNPINSANEAVFKSDLDAIESDLSLYVSSEYANTTMFSPDNLNADDLSVEYNGTVIVGKTIKDIIPALSTTNKYNGQFEVVNGKLVYVGTDRTKKRWAQDVNVEVIDADRLDAIISTATTLPISAGTDVVATIKISSNASINNINLTSKLELLDKNNVLVPVQPLFEIGTPTGTGLDTLRTVDVTIKTDTLTEGIYKLKLKAYSISNIYDVVIETDIVTSELFEIDNTPPTNPEMSVTPTGWTNLEVFVSITYPSDSVVKEYSLDGIIWNVYTNSITVNTNSTTIYARSTDIAGNQSGQSTITIANIDRESPTVVYGTNGGDDLQVASTTVIVTDVGVSGVDMTSLNYIWDTQNTVEPANGWIVFENGNNITKSGITGTYYLWIKATDNTGNSVITKSNAFIADNTAPENPVMSASYTGWTNGNVNVTITYSSDAALKEYSTDASTWNTYTAPVVISTNNTTVYARATDASGNQSDQSTMTIANIDKTLPTVTFSPSNIAMTNNDVSISVSAVDAGGSNMKKWRYRLSSNNGSTYGDWQGVNTGYNPTQTYTLGAGITVPVLVGLPMNLKQNQKYMLEFDYSCLSGTNIFNVDLWPDDLPEAHINATTALQHYIWNNITSSSINMNTANLRIFNDIIRPNPTDVYINNINLYPKETHSILLNSTGDWKIQIEAYDNANNSSIFTSNLFSIDKIAPTNPTMAASPTGWTNGNVAVTITYPGDSVIKQYSFDTITWNTYTSTVTVSNNTTVYARTSDASGNQSGQSTLTVSNIDKVAPTVIATYKKADTTSYVSDSWTNQSVTITAAGNDGSGSGVNRYQITYDGSTYYDLPNGTVTLSTTGRTGVWVRAIDNVENIGPNSSTYLVAIDKLAPTVSYSTNGATNVQVASTQITVNDAASLSGLNTSSLQYVWDVQNVTTPTVGWANFTNDSILTKLGVTGIYYLWIKASDNAGNIVVSKSNSFSIVSYYAFSYTGNYQTWTAPSTGKIKIETWGAMGGTPMGDNYYSGKGGYASGELNVNAGDLLYLYVGAYGINGGWNGGGKNSYQGGNNNFTGGGASDVRKNGMALSNRIIVAGGGGASGGWQSRGGDGGGLTGNSGTSISTYTGNRFGTGGTQASGGTGGTSTTYSNGNNGILGIGGDAYAASGGGGGGYYGGGGGTGINADDGGGGGGSSYIGGVLNGTTSIGANTDFNGKISITYIIP
jgi:hypothetical protein